jgi:uncharacterized protein
MSPRKILGRLSALAAVALAFGVWGLETASPTPGDCTANSTGAVKITVSPCPALMSQPLTISISGLPNNNTPVTLQVTSMDANNRVWKNKDTFPSGSGTVVIAPSLAQIAPGTCPIASDSMALIDNMRPYTPNGTQYADGSGNAYGWGQAQVGPSGRQFTFSVILNGQVVASFISARNALMFGENVQIVHPGAISGYPPFMGWFFLPPPGAPVHNRAAVLMFGGSEGGLSPALYLAASQLAANGYPSLAMAYWQGSTGSGSLGPKADLSQLPAQLDHIKLETFYGALAWMSKQSSVNWQRIFVSGTSYGSEAALLLASSPPSSSAYKGLVHGVIANVPSASVTDCYTPSGSCSGSAWALSNCYAPTGTTCSSSGPWYLGDLPHTITPGGRPMMKPESWIVPNFGPVFLDCGDGDQVWDSCKGMNDLKTNLSNAWTVECPDGGHGVGLLTPYSPTDPKPSTASVHTTRGAAYDSNRKADAAIWPQLLAFLATYSP